MTARPDFPAMIHAITKHAKSASAMAIMFEALDAAKADSRGLLDGICDNFNGPLAHKLLRAAGYEVTPEVARRIR